MFLRLRIIGGYDCGVWPHRTTGRHCMRKCVYGVILSVILFSLLGFGQDRPQSPSADYKFQVPAGNVWTDTGLDLNPGDRIQIRGGILDCGSPAASEKAHLPLPSAPGGALLARLHAEAPPVSASPDADIPIVDPSHLYLGVNAWGCDGKTAAMVHVLRNQPVGRTK